ncbi:MAG: Gfo/Idh/MocA family protein [Candidatus Omnitrophota bacterium]
MNVLVLGCGSIARRHIHNLVKFNEIKRIFVYTKSRDCFDLLDNSSQKIEAIKSVQAVTADFALICNQTNKHLNDAIKLAKRGMNIFTEKPLSMNLNNVFQLKRIVDRRKIKFAVGYNFRFFKAIEYVKAKLAAGEIGDLYFARIQVGQYLPDWRKAIDYRKSYSAKRKEGGGVALDLSHEIDYMRYLFGDPVDQRIINIRVSKLKIDSDDVFEGVYLYKNNFVCSVHMDYLEPQKRRQLRIVGSRGVIELDFVKAQIKIEKPNSKEKLIGADKYFNLDRTYVDELKDFITSIKTKRNPRVTIDDGIRVLELLREKNV